MREAIEHYGMAERDAKWLVCLSGGKDSYTLLAVLHELQRIARTADIVEEHGQLLVLAFRELKAQKVAAGGVERDQADIVDKGVG